MRRSEVIVNRLLEAEGQPGDEAEKCLPVPPEEAEVNHFKWPPIVPRSHASFQYDQGRKTRPPDEHFEFDITAPAVNPVKPEQQRLALEATCDLVDNLLDEPVDAANALQGVNASFPSYRNRDRVRHTETGLTGRVTSAIRSRADGSWSYSVSGDNGEEFYGFDQTLVPDLGGKPIKENEELPAEPDPRSEMDRLLPTTQSRLRGSSMIHAPGIINLAQMRWRERSKAAKKNGMDIIKMWQGLPEERYLRILNNDRITIETDGDDAIITFRDY